jgi:hypothetical protein
MAAVVGIVVVGKIVLVHALSLFTLLSHRPDPMTTCSGPPFTAILEVRAVSIGFAVDVCRSFRLWWQLLGLVKEWRVE